MVNTRSSDNGQEPWTKSCANSNDILISSKCWEFDEYMWTYWLFNNDSVACS